MLDGNGGEPIDWKLCFDSIRRGSRTEQALLAFVSGLPAGLPVDLESIQTMNCTGGNWGMGAEGGRRLRRTARRFLRECGTGRRLARPSRCGSRTATGRTGKRFLPVEASDAPEASSRKLVAPRPGHADLAGSQKFNFHDARYVLETGFGAGNSGASGGGGICEDAAEAIWDGDCQPHDSGGACASWNARRLGKKFERYCGDLDSPLRCVDASVQDKDEGGSGCGAESGRYGWRRI